jgi:hypothetical protein
MERNRINFQSQYFVLQSTVLLPHNWPCLRFADDFLGVLQVIYSSETFRFGDLKFSGCCHRITEILIRYFDCLLNEMDHISCMDHFLCTHVVLLVSLSFLACLEMIDRAHEILCGIMVSTLFRILDRMPVERWLYQHLTKHLWLLLCHPL